MYKDIQGHMYKDTYKDTCIRTHMRRHIWLGETPDPNTAHKYREREGEHVVCLPTDIHSLLVNKSSSKKKIFPFPFPPPAHSFVIGPTLINILTHKPPGRG